MIINNFNNNQHESYYDEKGKLKMYIDQIKQKLNYKFYITSICFIILLVAILCLVSCGAKKTVNLGNDIHIKNQYMDVFLTAQKVDYQYPVYNYLGEVQYAVRIKLKIKNNSSITAYPGTLILFKLINGSEYISCDTINTWNTTLTDIIAEEIPANTLTEGYIYCETNNNEMQKLEIDAIKKIEKNTAEYEIKENLYDKYIVNLR